MSARKLLFTVFGLLISALIAEAIVSHLHDRVSEAQHGAEDRRLRSHMLADELRQSSDELTRFARTYAVTGDARFEQYFGRVLEIRDGKAPRPRGYEGIYWDFVAAGHEEGVSSGVEISLLDLMREQGFTESEFDKLRIAKERSDALVELENRAMNAMKGRFPADDVRGARGEPDAKLARELLHGPEYHEAKAAIMEPIQEFLEEVSDRTRGEVRALRARGATLSFLSDAIALAAGLLALLAAFGLSRRLVRPVSKASERLETVALGMHATSQEQESGAAQQSASVEETRQTFTGFHDATRDLGRVGADVLQNAELAQTHARSIGTRIEELTSNTRSISEILKLVKGIANKSEVLALNAALEGTKAGEAGRGFSLVASQMQRLAEQVMGSVKKIETLTHEIEASSQNAILAAEEAEKVATLTTRAARKIAEAVSLQQSGAQQVAVAMDEITQVAERNVEAAATLVRSADDLTAVAGTLKKTMEG
jgi:methyl-accepting chemotaxis protein